MEFDQHRFVAMSNSSHIAYSLLIKDFNTLLEFVHPVDRNLSTYSHRMFELLLRICTEFENTCKEKLFHQGYDKPLSKLTIKDYNTLHTLFNLGRIHAGLNFWEPKKYITPFEDWNRDDSLRWYQAYNNVKHNRSQCFNEATFENVILALGGLTIMLERTFSQAVFEENRPSLHPIVVGMNQNERRYPNFPISLAFEDGFGF